MNNQIIAAIIGAVGAILAPLITILVQEILSQKRYKKTSRLKVLTENSWKGMAIQEFNDQNDKIEIPFEMEFRRRFNKVYGNAKYDAPEGIEAMPGNMNIKGGFLKDKFLKLDFRNKKPEIEQFGVFIFEMNSYGKTLNGRYCGYGPSQEKVIHGKIELKKQ